MTAAVLFLAIAHAWEPSPDDWRLFDLPYQSAEVDGVRSMARECWQFAERRAAAVNNQMSGRLDDCRRFWLAECRWRARVWYYADDLLNATAHMDTRMNGARRLRELLGPVDYLRGSLPAP